MNWNEREIGYALARGLFASRAIVLVPECSWPGSECDVLVVERRCRLIEVEVKATLADLLADARKDKWHTGWRYTGFGLPHTRGAPRDWPRSIWKHYYVFPDEIFAAHTDRILDTLPPKSGILTAPDKCVSLDLTVKRGARSNPDAKPLTAEQICDVARLANLRMWDAFNRERARDTVVDGCDGGYWREYDLV